VFPITGIQTPTVLLILMIQMIQMIPMIHTPTTPDWTGFRYSPVRRMARSKKLKSSISLIKWIFHTDSVRLSLRKAEMPKYRNCNRPFTLLIFTKLSHQLTPRQGKVLELDLCYHLISLVPMTSLEMHITDSGHLLNWQPRENNSWL
jgi:hypothetical protein